ncbi:hypothetical protein [Mesorhizobium sp.]|uniref:hypothetical protein n=1 Tax=Mesorhizobium sp. TaxID=1871066 RepID=UPI0025BC4135|nr:hypothetical protein [Mesorhizobium sp.]
MTDAADLRCVGPQVVFAEVEAALARSSSFAQLCHRFDRRAVNLAHAAKTRPPMQHEGVEVVRIA